MQALPPLSDFWTWLAGQPADRVIGTQCDPLACPLHTWLTERQGGTASVQYLWITRNKGMQHDREPTPAAWYALMRRIDDLPYDAELTFTLTAAQVEALRPEMDGA